MAVQNHKKPEQKKTANNPPAGYTYSRQATFPPRQAKTSAKKNKQRKRKKDKNGKTKNERRKIREEYARIQVAKGPLLPKDKTGTRRSDGNSRIHRIRTTKTESGKATEKAKRKKSQKAKRKKRPAYGTQSPVKFSAGRGSADIRVSRSQGPHRRTGHTSHAGRTGHETRTCHTGYTTRTDHPGLPDYPRPYEPRGKIPGVFCREGGIFH